MKNTFNWLQYVIAMGAPISAYLATKVGKPWDFQTVIEVLVVGLGGLAGIGANKNIKNHAEAKAANKTMVR